MSTIPKTTLKPTHAIMGIECVNILKIMKKWTLHSIHGTILRQMRRIKSQLLLLLH